MRRTKSRRRGASRAVPYLVLLSLAGVLLASASGASTTADVAVRDPLPDGVLRMPDGRLRVGLIVVDPEAQRFFAPVSVLTHDPPLERLVVATGPHASNALFEIGATPEEFDLACRLIGLSADGARRPAFDYDPAPVEGVPVDVVIEHQIPPMRLRADPAMMVIGGRRKPLLRNQWVYVGLEDEPSAAGSAGAVMGYLHDRQSILQHRGGIQHWRDTVAVRPDAVPPPGTRMLLEVSPGTYFEPSGTAADEALDLPGQ